MDGSSSGGVSGKCWHDLRYLGFALVFTSMNSPPPSTHPRLTVVLLIEDDDGIRNAISDALRIRGYHVIVEINMIESVAYLREGKADCVIIDRDNVELKGAEEIISLMCAAVPDVPFVVMAGEHAPFGTLHKNPQVTVLQKSFDFQEFLAAIPPASKG